MGTLIRACARVFGGREGVRTNSWKKGVSMQEGALRDGRSTTRIISEP